MEPFPLALEWPIRGPALSAELLGSVQRSDRADPTATYKAHGRADPLTAQLETLPDPEPAADTLASLPAALSVHSPWKSSHAESGRSVDFHPLPHPRPHPRIEILPDLFAFRSMAFDTFEPPLSCPYAHLAGARRLLGSVRVWLCH